MTFKSAIKAFGKSTRILLDKDFILTYWWKPNERAANNWGDVLNSVLIQNISGKKPYNIPEDFSNYLNRPIYAVMGSLLHQNELTRCGNNLVIWRPGFISKDSRIKVKPKEICAVRGPLSRDILIKQGYSCPEVYGDPALLYPQYYQSKAKKEYKLGIIPHYVDKKLVPSDFLNDQDILLIDIQGGINQVVDQICSCRKVASSSLHGVIAADAYGIPSTWIKFSDQVVGGGFKFYDYFYSVGRMNERSLEIDDNSYIDDILDAFGNYKLDFDLQELWEACPFRPE